MLDTTQNNNNNLYEKLLDTEYCKDIDEFNAHFFYDDFKELCLNKERSIEKKKQMSHNNFIIFLYRLSKSPDLYPVSSSINPNSFINVCKIIWRNILTDGSVEKYNNYEELFKEELTRRVINYYIKPEEKERKRV